MKTENSINYSVSPMFNLESSLPSTIGREARGHGKIGLEIWKCRTYGWIAQAQLTNISSPCFALLPSVIALENIFHFSPGLFLGHWFKPQPNDRKMSTQHIATLLGATCCMRLATLLQHVAPTMLRNAALTCCDRLAAALSWNYDREVPR